MISSRYCGPSLILEVDIRAPNKRLQRTRHEASLLSCVAPLRRGVTWGGCDNKRIMKYQVSFLIVLMLVHPGCSSQRLDQPPQQAAHQAEDDPILTLGMSHKLALEIIKECGGQDITSKLAVIGPQGEWPLSGLFWSLEQYNSVLEIVAEDGNVVGIGYWTVADFSESKSHRVESRRSLKSLTFEKQARTLKTQVL